MVIVIWRAHRVQRDRRGERGKRIKSAFPAAPATSTLSLPLLSCRQHHLQELVLVVHQQHIVHLIVSKDRLKSVFPAAPPHPTHPHLRDPRRRISVDGRSALPLAYPIILGVPVAIVTIVTIVTSITLVIDIIIVIICN